MNKKGYRGICGLLIFLSFAGTGVAKNLQNENLDSGNMLSNGKFDSQKALSVWYNNAEVHTGESGKYYVNVKYEDTPHAFRKLCKMETSEEPCSAKIVFNQSFQDGNTQKNLLITEVKPNTPIWHGCHVCSVVIGAAIFAKSGNGWKIEVANQFIGYAGKWGTLDMETFKLIKLGENKHGILMQGKDCHQGYVSNYVSLILPKDDSMKMGEIHLLVGGPSTAVCPEAIYNQGIDIKTVPNDNNEYFDLEVTARYNSGTVSLMPTSSSSRDFEERCLDLKQIVEKRLFHFTAGKYHLSDLYCESNGVEQPCTQSKALE